MAENSGIAWTDCTFNPWIGCTKVGPGCDHCYAEAWDKRFAGTTLIDMQTHWGAGVPRRRTTDANWHNPLKWQRKAKKSGKPIRVFCASLADVFDNEIDPLWREDLWWTVAQCPDLQWQFVTKRVGNVARMAPRGGLASNAILIATIVDQAEADRDMDKLVNLRHRGIAKYVGVSYEPALGPVDWSRWIDDLDWIIVGGESDQGASNARRFDLAWGRSTISQCAVAGVSVFMKQVGSRPYPSIDPLQRPDDITIICDRAGADPDEWPEDLRVRQFPVMGRNADVA